MVLKKTLIFFILVALHVCGYAQTSVKPNNSKIKFTGSLFNRINENRVVFFRHSDTFYALSDKTAMASDSKAKTNTGVSIIFRTDATDVGVHFRMLSGANAWKIPVSYYVDGDSIASVFVKRNDLTNANDSTFTFNLNSTGGGEHTYRVVMSTFCTVGFEGLTLAGGSESLVEPEMAKKPLYVAYGNSITHGRGQELGDQTYPWILAEKMGWQLCNIAVGGSRVSVPMAEMVADEITEKIDFMTILIGYNDMVGASKDTTYYRGKLIAFIDTVRKGHPETKIFVLGQTYTEKTENGKGESLNFDNVRKVQKYIVDSLKSKGDTKIHFIKTDTWTGHDQLNNPPTDVVHLNKQGAYMVGVALADTITRILKHETAIFKHRIETTSISVYPNPAVNEFTVLSKRGELGIIEIYNIAGERVYLNKTVSKGCKSINIKIGDLPQGTYILKTKSGIKKILKI